MWHCGAPHFWDSMIAIPLSYTGVCDTLQELLHLLFIIMTHNVRLIVWSLTWRMQGNNFKTVHSIHSHIDENVGFPLVLAAAIRVLVMVVIVIVVIFTRGHRVCYGR